MRYNRSRLEETTGRSIVGGRWLAVHLTEQTGRGTEALRSDLRLRSVLCANARDLIALDFNGLLCFDQVILQLLKCSILCINLVMQATEVLKQELLLHLHLTQYRLVLGKIIMHICIDVIQVSNLTVLVL